MIKRLTVIIAILFLIPKTIGDEKLDSEKLENWPTSVISFAYMVANSGFSLETLEPGQGLNNLPEGPYREKLQQLYDIFFTQFNDWFALYGLFGVNHYCHIRWIPHFSCGDPEKRHFTDAGYLYVSDPIVDDSDKVDPFLLVIMVGISPRRTRIFRLFQDRLELVYDLFDHKNYPCGITDPGTALFVTYGFDIDEDGNFLLTETEGFHWPEMFPKRQFKLEITASTCTLTKVKEWWEE